MLPRRPAVAPPSDRTLHSLLRHYGAGDPLACRPVAQGLLNHGYRLRTTRGWYFLKHYLDDPDHPERRATHPATIGRQHRATLRLRALGLPVAAPLTCHDGRTVLVIGGRPYALYPWVDGRHRAGSELDPGQSHRLGRLLGRVHLALERVLEPPGAPSAAAGAGGDGHAGAGGITGGMEGAGGPGRGCASAEESDALIGELLRLVRRHEPRDAMDALARRRLLERRALLERHAHRRPPDAATPAAGWVHGDFHPFNLLYRGAEPAAIVDWDRLGVQPRAEEAVRAAVIFFLAPDGALDLAKVGAYARAYRLATGVPAAELAAAVRRVWWERLNDFWMLRWRYERHDCRADPLFPAAAALVVWWTREYEAVLAAFTG